MKTEVQSNKSKRITIFIALKLALSSEREDKLRRRNFGIDSKKFLGFLIAGLYQFC